jgi:hypothetical protein
MQSGSVWRASMIKLGQHLSARMAAVTGGCSVIGLSLACGAELVVQRGRFAGWVAARRRPVACRC